MSERFASTSIDQAVARALAPLPPLFRAVSSPIEVTFPAADTRRDVLHGMDGVPDGWLSLWADTLIHATPGVSWTRDVAYLQSPTADARALVVFVLLDEERR